MKKLILTCEHAGAKIPRPYQKLFKNKSSVLKTHRGLDIGAFAIALDLKKQLQTDLHFSLVSRLVIDLNRFLNSSTLFSEFTQTLSLAEKKHIIARYYRPHWNKVQKQFLGLAKKNHKVFHIAVHSMTDELHGQIRPMQLALLYDPKRPREKEFARLWIQELRQEFPGFTIARNKPYHGAGEGLTSALRTQMKDGLYVGIELEMNQGYLQLIKNNKTRQAFSQSLADSLQRAVLRSR